MVLVLDEHVIIYVNNNNNNIIIKIKTCSVVYNRQLPKCLFGQESF